MRKMVMILAALAALTVVAFAADVNRLKNGSFEQGATGWEQHGLVRVLRASGAKPELLLGPGAASVSQRYDVPGLRILYFGATLRVGFGSTDAEVRVRGYDSKNRLVMDVRQPLDPKKATEGAETGVYFKTQALTTYVVAGIETDGKGKAPVSASAASLVDYDHDRVEHQPLCDLDRYLQPIWQGDTVYDESVLLYSQAGGPATGRLLFNPRKVLSVRDSTLGTAFAEGVDYRVEGKTLVAIAGSKISTVADTEVPKGDYPWLSVAGRHIVVTYTHDDAWSGPTPSYEGDGLPQTIAKLRDRKPLTIVALGDSITLGINVSGYREEPPYMPTWPELFVKGLSDRYKNPSIKLYNTALGGQTSAWGKDQAKSAVAALDPDLVLIAFGMNDFWSLTPAEFRDNVKAIIDTVRARRSRAEFILISSIKFDPDYTKDPTYVGHLAAYADSLKTLVGPGIRLFDMTAISDALYQAKSAKDLETDPMHPDDFLARWYAQGLIAMLSANP